MERPRSHKVDESRVIRGPGMLSVYVPPKPPEKPGDEKLDLPPGYPPEVHYDDVMANYWLVLREGSMLYMGLKKTFTEAQMEWLRSIQPKVEELLREN